MSWTLIIILMVGSGNSVFSSSVSGFATVEQCNIARMQIKDALGNSIDTHLIVCKLDQEY